MILDEITKYLDSIKIRYNIENANITVFIGSSEGFLQVEYVENDNVIDFCRIRKEQQFESDYLFLTKKGCNFNVITYSKPDEYNVAMFDETNDTIEEVINSIDALIDFIKKLNKIESKIESKIEEIKELSLSLRNVDEDFNYFMEKYIDD